MKTNKNISIINNCCGCFSCKEICPKKCIEISEDNLGHQIPTVVNENCINCGLCISVCPAYNESNFTSSIDIVAACKKDLNERRKSSSGGIAAAISEFFIQNNGVVYGCSFIKEFSFKHIRCTSLEDIDKLRGSKYVQSDISEVYKQIKQDLKSNKKVLFIGTPCQVDGVIKHFKGKFSNLYTIDLICHGVPSLKLLKDSLPTNLINNSEIETFKFRNNNTFQIEVYSRNKKIYTRPLCKDLYLKGFFTSLFYRKSCYSCKYAKPERISDITIGDFWGIQNIPNNINPEEGISLCLINTRKGQNIINELNNIIIIKHSTISEAINGNKQLRHPVKYSLNAKIFHALYNKLGFRISVIASIPGIILKNLIFNKK